MNIKPYLLRVDEIARDMGKAFDDATKRFDAAEAARKKNPVKHNTPVSDEYLAKSLQCEADYRREKAALETLKRTAPGDVSHKTAVIRSELVKAVDEAFAVKPELLDQPTLELLKTGALRLADYERFMHDAEANENATMARIIGEYAGRAAEAEKDQLAAAALRGIADRAGKYNGAWMLGSFDALVYTLNRAVNNPYIFQRWDELTAPFIAQYNN